MNKAITSSFATYGFISVRQFEGVGYCGGLLIVSQLGRPLEFHCSAPIQPNRGQEILYGRTYPTYLFCEQIGLALIEKAKTTPSLFLANSDHLLALNTMTTVPVVALLSDAENESAAAHAESFLLGKQRLWYSWGAGEELERAEEIARDSHPHPPIESIIGLLDRFTKSLTLDEPFERIEKAIEEAQAVAR